MSLFWDIALAIIWAYTVTAVAATHTLYYFLEVLAMNREDYMSLSGVDYIRAMFANTKEDGSLILENEGEESFNAYVDWQEADVEKMVERFEALLAALTQLGKEHAYWEVSTKDMPETLLEVWNTYIVPYPDHGMDDEALFDIFLKAEADEPLTDAELSMLEKQRSWMRENALTRLPEIRCNPSPMIQRARRYERLMARHAPKIVLDNEARCLAEEMVLYYHLAV